MNVPADAPGEVGVEVDEARLALRVGMNIRALRDNAALSTRQLAARAGISQPFLSQLERGASSPSMVTIYRIAEALGVLPAALVPSPETSLVSLVRANEGTELAVANRPDAARGRALLMRSSSPLEVIEYLVSPDQHIAEWFRFEGHLALYVVSGQMTVEIESVGSYELGPRDLLAHPATLRHRWLLVDNQPAHVLLTVAHAAAAHS